MALKQPLWAGRSLARLTGRMEASFALCQEHWFQRFGVSLCLQLATPQALRIFYFVSKQSTSPEELLNNFTTVTVTTTTTTPTPHLPPHTQTHKHIHVSTPQFLFCQFFHSRQRRKTLDMGFKREQEKSNNVSEVQSLLLTAVMTLLGATEHVQPTVFWTCALATCYHLTVSLQMSTCYVMQCIEWHSCWEHRARMSKTLQPIPAPLLAEVHLVASPDSIFLHFYFAMDHKFKTWELNCWGGGRGSAAVRPCRYTQQCFR